MAKLNCSAKNCTNNYDSYCCINEIKVGGAQASAPEATCCENFQESKGLLLIIVKHQTQI